ncbi:hypothetical protein HK096_000480 [Nowakowskiella sp. JEL0078]|nr:hypothetical protein HK096_000480 [Nowakowskiella sp. JEL0078]
MEDDDGLQVNAWEKFKRSWDQIKEDESGSLHPSVLALQALQLKRRKRVTKKLQRGIIRHVFLLLDLSKAMSDSDLKPNRLDCCLNLMKSFITEFFDQNPLSQLGIIVTKNGLADRVSELSGNPSDHTSILKSTVMKETGGEPSLQNALELACDSLSLMKISHAPSHGSREILALWSSLTTCDPGNIENTLTRLKTDSVRVSMVSLSAEVAVCKRISKETNGLYSVILNEQHFKVMLFENLPPPPVNEAKIFSNMVQMGFPECIIRENPVFCACHQGKPTRKGYSCPRCKSFLCTIPTDCPVCMLTLVSSPLLARSYHHIFPVSNFEEQKREHDPLIPSYCFSCQAQSAGFGTNKCPDCNNLFCIDCDIFIHDVLHNCPGCLNR